MSSTALRWWPAIALPTLLVIGLIVGPTSTPLDDRFLAFGAAHRGLRRALILFTFPTVVAMIFVFSVGVAVGRRQWRTLALIVVAPALGLLVMRALKRIFGRTKEGVLAYPSGHITLTVVVVGMTVVVLGAAWWMWVLAATWWTVALLGQALGYHYFTDTVGGLLLGTAVLALAIRFEARGRLRRDGGVDHSGG